eukprot:CAMPEP_0113530206 /NCGR_PEP_ID=MMETSP0015_2-20120614/2809_1 /TAXON_ID=2838 /ORGANISM="Odontella" /LENGTH=285 /DNA_ID=CAMNT_0000428899 /DNA_START=79 /DNA_END=936 /DNA_ORIENTATION=+ /assembly_acc=CAM_ASM_000160
MAGFKSNPLPAANGTQLVIFVTILALASLQTSAFSSGIGWQRRQVCPLNEPSQKQFFAVPSGRLPRRFFLYVDPNNSNPIPRTAPEMEEKKGRSVAEGSIPCAASDPLCKGTTPTPLGTKQVTEAKRRRRSKSAVKKKSYLHAVNSPEEYESEVLGSVDDDTIVIVRFHAPYCKACKMIAFAYDRFAQKTVASINPDNLYGVKFVDVEILDKNDYPDLDIPATPYSMIYHPTSSGLQVVEEGPIARRQFSKFKKTLNFYRKGMCDMPEEFFTNPHYMFEDENLIL